MKNRLDDFKTHIAAGLPIYAAILCFALVVTGCKHGGNEGKPGARKNLPAYTLDKCPIETMAFRDAEDQDWCRQKIDKNEQWDFLDDESMQGVERLKTIFQAPMPEDQAAQLEANLPEPPEDLKFKDFLIQFSDPGAGIAAHITGANKLVRLKYLQLHFSYVDDRGTKKLTDSTLISQLLTLDLSNNFITAAGVKNLAASGKLNNLTSLNLSENAFEDSGATAIADARGLNKLKTLKLYYCGIGDKGAAAIADSKALPNLEELDLSENSISDRGIIAISESNNLKSLKKLVISENPTQKDRIRKAIDTLKQRGVKVEN